MTHPRFVLSYKFLEFDYCDKRLKLVLGMDHYIFHMKLGKSKKIMGGYLVQQIVAKPDIWSCKFFCVYRLYKESISKEQNTDNDLHLYA